MKYDKVRNLFVAVFDDPDAPAKVQFVTSPDGITWTAASEVRASPTQVSGEFAENFVMERGIWLFSSQPFVGTTFPQIHYSFDGGINWAFREIPNTSSPLRDMMFAGDRAWAVGVDRIYCSGVL